MLSSRSFSRAFVQDCAGFHFPGDGLVSSLCQIPSSGSVIVAQVESTRIAFSYNLGPRANPESLEICIRTNKLGNVSPTPQFLPTGSLVAVKHPIWGQSMVVAYSLSWNPRLCGLKHPSSILATTR